LEAGADEFAAKFVIANFWDVNDVASLKKPLNQSAISRLGRGWEILPRGPAARTILLATVNH